LAPLACQLAFMSRSRRDIRFCQSSDGVRIAYASGGSGPSLVRVGPWHTHVELDWSSPIWLPWLRFLANDRTLVHYDFRGHGLSDRQVGDVAFERHVDDLAAVVASNQTKHCALLGIAGGCAVGEGPQRGAEQPAGARQLDRQPAGRRLCQGRGAGHGCTWRGCPGGSAAAILAQQGHRRGAAESAGRAAVGVRQRPRRRGAVPQRRRNVWS